MAVEDEPTGLDACVLVGTACDAAHALRRDLGRHGYETSLVGTGRELLDVFDAYDLILLDTDLPDLDGVSLCRGIRQRSEVPIIGFASGAAEVDTVLLLEAGCDDCIGWPYRERELVARINAVLRRTFSPRSPQGVRQMPTDGEELTFGPLVIDLSRREARFNGWRLALTRKEFDLLHTLAAEPDRIFRRHELMSEVWDYPQDNRISVQASRTIDTHVSSLRGKLGGSDWITTIRGIGFRFGGAAQDLPGAAPGPESETAEAARAAQDLRPGPRAVGA